MLPSWKIKREARRVLQQVVSFPVTATSFFFSTLYYDRVLSKRIRQTEGALPFAKRIAIYLIFPRDRLLASHLTALQYIARCGYAPLIVSNLPIKEGDRAVALQHCWRLIERANYGYDFGGYRDGILSLRGQLGDLTALALLNDSTWFPLPGGSDWLAEAEGLHVAFAGAASNFGAARVPVSDYQRIAWRYSSDHKNFHHCSFALLLSQPALGDPRLLEFWQSFRLSRDKKRTVRRGEIGLTQWMIRHGYSHADTLDIAALDADLKDLPEARIVEILNRLIIPEDERLFAAKHSVLEDADLKTEGWRDRAEGFILTAVARQGISYALAEFITKERKFPFLKKSPVWLNPEASDITLQLALDLKGEFADTVVSEIKALRKRNR